MKPKPAPKVPRKLVSYCQFSIPRIRQNDLAEAIGVHPTLVSKIFSGQRKLTPKNADLLHDKLHIPYEVMKQAISK